MTELLKGVFSLSVSAVPVILAVMIGRFILGFAPKKYSYALWSVVLFRLCVPVSFTSRFSLASLMRSIASLFEKGSEAQNITPSLPPLTESVTELIPSSPVVTVPAVDSVGMAETLPAVENASRSVSFSDILPTLLAALWVIGIAAFLVLGAVSYVKLKRSVSDARHTEGRVYVHGKVESPFVIGILKARVILPEGLDEETAEAVLAHESCHIRRGDHVIKTVAFLVLAVHWFNPFCYLAFFLMSRDMEMSCDEKVLTSMDHPDKRKEYSMAILKTATRNKSIRSTVSFGAVGIKRRIKRALDYKKPSVFVTVLSLIIVTVMLFGCAADEAVDTSYGEYVPRYEELEPTSVEISPLDDAVTRALVERIKKNSLSPDSYPCTSHKILKTLENKDENTVSVLLLRGSDYSYSPTTGRIASSVSTPVALSCIKFGITENGYERRNLSWELDEYDGTVEYIYGEFFDSIEEGNKYVSDILLSLDTTEYDLTPLRYEKDGILYEPDEGQQNRYYESLIGAVLDSEENYDDPEGYITENSEAFEKLYTEIEIDDFLIHEFMKGGNDDLRGYVMYRALEEYLKYENEPIKFSEPFEFDPTDESGKKNGQKYFDAFVKAAVDMYTEEGYYTVYCKNYRTWIKVFELFMADMTAEEYASLDHMYPLPDKIAVNGDEKIEFAKGEEKYYELFKCASWFFFDTEWAKSGDNSIQYLGEISGLDDPEVEAERHDLIWDVPAVEFVYDDVKTGYVIADGGWIVLIEKETDSGETVYDAYRPNRVGAGLEYYLRCNFREE